VTHVHALVVFDGKVPDHRERPAAAFRVLHVRGALVQRQQVLKLSFRDARWTPVTTDPFWLMFARPAVYAPMRKVKDTRGISSPQAS